MPSMAQSKQDTRVADTASEVISLVDKAKDGSRTAFGQLVNLFQDDIFRLVYYRTRSSMDAEDLTQEIFIQAFRKEISLVLKKNESTVKTHLYRGLLKFKKESSLLQLLREEAS